MKYGKRWMDIFHSKEITLEEGKAIIEDSKHNFIEHFNKGWIKYRKSVAECGNWAVTKWNGSGANCKDILGREFIDCLGGYGVMNLGWGNPEVFAAVNNQLY